jgi:putative oxidoreductase
MITARSESASASPTKINLVALILRVSLAVIFLYHGISKVTDGAAGANWVGRYYEHVDVEVPPTLTFAGTQYAVAWGELLGGVAMLLGFLTRLAALGLIVIQTGAVMLVTAPRGFSLAGGVGYEYNLALLAMCLCLLLTGSGLLSLDAYLKNQRARAKAQRAGHSLGAPHLATVGQGIPGQPGTR